MDIHGISCALQNISHDLPNFKESLREVLMLLDSQGALAQLFV